MNKPLEQLLQEATKDILSPETLVAITEAFNQQVESVAKEKLLEAEAIFEQRKQAAVEEALTAQDNDYTSKLEKLLEAIDNDHTIKLERIVSRVDDNHAAKLVALSEKYNNEAKAEAEAFKQKLVEKVSKFLDLRLNEAIPTQQIAEAVSNRRAQRIVDAIRGAVALDEKFINNEIRSALEDGKKQITESKKTINELQQKVQVLTEQSQKLQTNLILEQKTTGLSKEKKDYVMKVLAGKGQKFINENFTYVVDMFEKHKDEEVETLKESAKSTTKTENIDQPENVISESTEDVDPTVASYLEGLQ